MRIIRVSTEIVIAGRGRGDNGIVTMMRMLPDLDGIQVVRWTRAAEISVPILMLTARGQIEDRVSGLDAGADDYLPEPFAITELLTRVRALSR